MFTEKPLNVFLFCLIVTLCTGVLQYLNPGISLIDSGMVISIVLTVFLNKDAYTFFFGAVAILFIIISAFYEHQNLSQGQVLTQHLFSAIVIVLAIIAVLYIKNLYRSIEFDERQVTALFEHATEGIVLTNRKGQIVLINPAATNLFRYDDKELLGKKIETLIPDRLHHNHLDSREGFYKHPSNRQMGHGRDLFAKTKDGKEIPVEVSLSFYSQKNEFYVIAFIVDITTRKLSEKALVNQKIELERISEAMKKLNADLETKVEQRTLILREALQELEKSQGELNEALSKEKELSEIKSRFVSMASHEFRTPLSTILSSATLISKYKKTEEQENRDKHINRIKDSVKHLNVLLEDFLSLGRLEEGRIIASPASFIVKEFMEEVVDEMKPSLKENQTIQAVHLGEKVFCSDKRLLKNILINLLSNAIKFSTDSASIRLDINNSKESMEITVRDKGIGISEEDQQHLFSSFFRGKNVINIEGTGLGLHIVRRYTELLQGNLQLESRLHEGTTVTLNTPALPAYDKPII